jgi:DNA-binding transcriptional MerR regulator
MEYRIDQLAGVTGVSVDTLRYYQSRRLLPAPLHHGRRAWYGAEHLARVERIRDLQRRGLTLAGIRRVLDGSSDPTDRDLASAVAAARAPLEEPALSLDEMATRCRIPIPLLQAFMRNGVDLGRRVDGELCFTQADVAMVELGLRLLTIGLPLPDLLALAKAHTEGTRVTAERAVRLFDEHVRAPLRASGASERDVDERLVAVFDDALAAITELVAIHFRQVLLGVAEGRIAHEGDRVEVARAAASR